MQKVESFDAEYDGFKTMAHLMDPGSSNQRPYEPSDCGNLNVSPEFNYPCLMALRLRASQKQVLWEVMVSLLEFEG